VSRVLRPARHINTTKLNQIYQFFSESNLINDDSIFCSQILLTIDLQCNVFRFAKLLLNVCHCPDIQFIILTVVYISGQYVCMWSLILEAMADCMWCRHNEVCV